MNILSRKKNVTLLNIIFSLLQQLVVTISGFILPRYILYTFGSEVNGLVSSLTQFLSYISLIEGGVTGVISASLYKTLVSGDNKQLSCVLKTATSFYRKIGLFFIGYTILIACMYPVLVQTEFSYGFVSTLVLILSINLFVQYFFSITWKTLLEADKKGYLVSATYILVVILNTIITVVVIKMYPNIHIVKLVSALIYLAQPLAYNYFVKKIYKVDYQAEEDMETLTQRWDGFGINVAAFVHNNTDVVVLTLLGTLSDVSIYSTYYMVVFGLRSIVAAISKAISPSVGHVYAKGDKIQLNKSFDLFECVILFVSFFLFTVGGMCITPFVLMYTNNVLDANYNQPLFGWILVVAELIYCIRDPYVSLAYCANRFKDFKNIAYIEAILNIAISVIGVSKFGLVGVAIGTLISMLFRTIHQIVYLKRHILHRSMLKLFKGIIGYCIGMGSVVILSNVLFDTTSFSIISWVIYAVKNSILALIILGLITVVLYKDTITQLFQRLGWNRGT